MAWESNIDGLCEGMVLVLCILLRDRPLSGQMYLYRVCAKRTHVPRPPRSPDLSACDFFLWGYLKSKIYVRKHRTVDDVKVSIREEIAIMPQEML